MKTLLALVALLLMAGAAEVDVKLFDNENPGAYYDAFKAGIDRREASGESSAAQAAEERQQLSRLRSAAAQEVQVETYDDAPLKAAQVEAGAFFDALRAAAALQAKESAQRRLGTEVQTKLQFLKRSIDRLTEAERPRLPLYQLQFAYYKVQLGKLEERTALLQSRSAALQETLAASIGRVGCKEETESTATLESLDAAVDTAEQKVIALDIDLEKALIEENSRRDELLRQSGRAKEALEQARAKKLAVLGEELVCMLARERKKAFLEQMTAFEALASQMNAPESYRAQAALLRALSETVFGTTRLLLATTAHESRAILKEGWNALTEPLFVFNERPISFMSLLKALAIIVAGFAAGGFYKRWVVRLARRWRDMSQMSIRLASNIGNYLIIFVALMIAIGSIGIDLSSLSLIAGALSIGIGFGLQTVVSNLIAGVILMFERTIRIGDTIELSDTLRGRVSDMRIRSTTIRTFDNIDIVIPNSSFIQNNVVNWTLEDNNRRLRIPFGVAYGSEVEAVRNAVLGELRASSLVYLRDDPEKEPDVWMTGMGSSSVDFELLVWVEWDSRLKPSALRSDFLILIYNALNRHGIPIPFPQLDLHVKELPGNRDAE